MEKPIVIVVGRYSFQWLVIFLVASLVITLYLAGAGEKTWKKVADAYDNHDQNHGEANNQTTTFTSGNNSFSQCDLSSGKWVYDNKSYPLYKEQECTFMWDEFACQKFGREDLMYQNWRWQPHQCDLPRFNATALLEKLRGKRLVFVGDSLNRDQWVSMVCLVESAIPEGFKYKKRNENLMIFMATQYNASIEFYWSPLLVESNSDDPVSHRLPERIVRVNEMGKHARHWTTADILVFNTYLWWRQPQMKLLWGSFEDEDKTIKQVEMLKSYELGLNTWSQWLNIHVNRSKTQMYFMSMSPTHLWGAEWGKPHTENCYGEKEPIFKDGYWGSGSDIRMMQIVENSIHRLRSRGLKIQMLNITQLSEYRKDGHPSSHRRQWTPLTEEQKLNPRSYSDCVHWCLPGVPDVWNEILYAHMFHRS